METREEGTTRGDSPAPQNRPLESMRFPNTALDRRIDVNASDLEQLSADLNTALAGLLTKNQVKGLITLRRDGTTFHAPEDLLKVRGIGRSNLQAIAERLRLGLEPLETPVRLNFHVHGTEQSRELGKRAHSREFEIFRSHLESLEPGRGVNIWIENGPSLTGSSAESTWQVCAGIARKNNYPVAKLVSSLIGDKEDPKALKILKSFFDEIMSGHDAKRDKEPIKFMREDGRTELADLLESESHHRRVRIRAESPIFEAWRVYARGQEFNHRAINSYVLRDELDKPITEFARYYQCLMEFDRLRDVNLAQEIAEAVSLFPTELHLLSRGFAHGPLLMKKLAEHGVAFQNIENANTTEVLSPRERYFAMGCPEPETPEVRKLLMSHWLFASTSNDLKAVLGQIQGKDLEGELSTAIYALSADELSEWWYDLRSKYPAGEGDAFFAATNGWFVARSPGLPEIIKSTLSELRA